MHWTGTDVAAAAAAASAVCAGALFIWRRGVRPVTKFVSEFGDDWKGTPARPGVPRRPGVMERLSSQDEALARIDDRVAVVEAQVKPNGGASMHDAVARIEQQITAVSAVTPEIHIHPGGGGK